MRIIHIFLIVTLLSACVKSGDGPNYPIFTGFTNTYFDGSIIGYEDLTDWTLDDFWFPCEKNLFSNYNITNLDNNCDSQPMFYISHAYPNPSSDVVCINMTSEQALSSYFVFVNRSFNVINEIENFQFVGEYTKCFDLSSVPNNSLIRCYYIFSSDNCTYKGHGDIKIKR